MIALATTGLWLLHGRDPVGAAALAGPVPSRPPVVPALGVFRGTSAEAVRAFGRWLDEDRAQASELTTIVDFPDRQTWAQIADPAGTIDEWSGSGFDPVYSVAMLPEDDGSASVAAGAAGAYDHWFAELGGRLVAAGQPAAKVRLGWEFNLAESRWSTGDRAAFIAYWRRIVAAMRSVPDARFTFDWNPNNGDNPYDAVLYYPGDDVVDRIAVDAYDISWAWHSYPYPDACDPACRLGRQRSAWQRWIYGGRRGLGFWSAFARRRGKPMSLPEWGLWTRPDGHGGGDDPYYLGRMHAFITDPANAVAYQAYFEFDGPDGPHRLMTDYPHSAVVFKKLFGG